MRRVRERLEAVDHHRPGELEAHVYPEGVEVTHLSVNGPARRRGVATEMLEDVIDIARDAGADHVSVVIGGGRASLELLRGLDFDATLDNDGVVHGRLELGGELDFS